MRQLAPSRDHPEPCRHSADHPHRDRCPVRQAVILRRRHGEEHGSGPQEGDGIDEVHLLDVRDGQQDRGDRRSDDEPDTVDRGGNDVGGRELGGTRREAGQQRRLGGPERHDMVAADHANANTAPIGPSAEITTNPATINTALATSAPIMTLRLSKRSASVDITGASTAWMK